MTACRLNPPFRAEHVGSLLRPRALKDAARAHARGECPHAEFLAVLEREIARAVRMQEQIGLRLVTDGEFGRSSWFGFLFERLEGFSLAPSLFRFRDAHGREYEWMTCFTDAPIRRPRPVCVDEYRRVAALSSRTVKANLPSPTALHFFRGEACRDPQVYPDLEQWWDDVVAVYQGELRDLAAAGCRYLQLDEVPLAMLCDARVRAQIAAGGRDPQALLRDYVGVVNRILRARPPEVTRTLEASRGALAELPRYRREVEETLRSAERDGIRLITVLDDTYPWNLRTIHNLPPFLFYRGELQPQDARAVAVVGTRAPSAEGLIDICRAAVVHQATRPRRRPLHLRTGLRPDQEKAAAARR